LAVFAAFLSSPLRALGVAGGGGGGVSETFLFAGGAATMGGSGVAFAPLFFATSAGAPEVTKITIKIQGCGSAFISSGSGILG
jgi:hypothetical protein